MMGSSYQRTPSRLALSAATSFVFVLLMCTDGSNGACTTDVEVTDLLQKNQTIICLSTKHLLTNLEDTYNMTFDKNFTQTTWAGLNNSNYYTGDDLRNLCRVVVLDALNDPAANETVVNACKWLHDSEDVDTAKCRSELYYYCSASGELSNFQKETQKHFCVNL